jgi:hypothetical protein
MAVPALGTLMTSLSSAQASPVPDLLLPTSSDSRSRRGCPTGVDPCTENPKTDIQIKKEAPARILPVLTLAKNKYILSLGGEDLSSLAKLSAVRAEIVYVAAGASYGRLDFIAGHKHKVDVNH